MKASRIAALTTGLLLAAGGPLAADSGHSAGEQTHDYVCKPDPAKLQSLQTLYDRDAHALYFYGTHECPGGIYLRDWNIPDGQREAPLIPVLSDWWLERFIVARWVDIDADELEVRAYFITGIGPTSVRPFCVQVRMRRSEAAWQADEPQIVPGGHDLPTVQSSPNVKASEIG